MNDSKVNLYTEYCTGCGLCGEYADVKFESRDGFDVPKIQSQEQISFCQKICPVNALNFNGAKEHLLFGTSTGMFRGWSTDSEVRYKAASGGVISALCIYLLEHKLVDAVLQIGEDPHNTFYNVLRRNTTRQAVIESCASRYITGLTFSGLRSLLEDSKSYCIVGKPCDIECISNLMESDDQLREQIKYRLTFFCAGAPSRNASERLADKLGISDKKSIRHIRYRGYGWPGETSVFCDDSDVPKTMKYISAWNGILGRDIRKMCKFCINGIGNIGDISCGDLWKTDVDGCPIFTESNGQNIVIARTDQGKKLLMDAQRSGYLVCTPYSDLNALTKIQSNHSTKRSTILGKYYGCKIMHKPFPEYNVKGMRDLCKSTSRIKLLKTVLGTIKRIRKGKI